MSGLRVELIGEADALAAIASPWWRLWDRVSTATPFQTPAWLLAWWQAFAPGELAVTAAWQNSALVGIAPFYVEQSTRGQRLLPLGISVSDYHDILLDPAADSSVAAALIEPFDAIGWEEWQMSEQPDGRCAATALPVPPACEDIATPASCCPVLTLPHEMTTLLHRKLRQAHRRADRLGGAQIHEIAEAGIADWVDRLAALHEARWRTRGEDGVLRDPRVRRLHTLALPQLQSRGLARLFELRIAGQLAGMYYGFAHAAHAYAYIGGFDPAFAAVSPGMLLIEHAIAQAAGEGAREFDFLRGREDYKYRWGARDRWSLRRTIRRRHARAA